MNNAPLPTPNPGNVAEGRARAQARNTAILARVYALAGRVPPIATKEKKA